MYHTMLMVLVAVLACSPAFGQQFVQVFVTNDSFDGDFGGLAGADLECTNAARRVGLGGDWVAWLSDAAGLGARNRIADSQYILLDGTIIADNLNDLTDGMIRAPINVTETLAVVPGRGLVWTGTRGNGTTGTATCNSWTSTDGIGNVGQTDQTDSLWTLAQDRDCGLTNRLYCFSEERGVPPSGEVPDVEGESVDDAVAELEAEGYVVETVNVVNCSVPPGTVVDQDPDAGTSLPSGSTVTLTVAICPTGPDGSTVRAIPTLSEWGMILMIALLAFIGGRRIWRS